MRQKQRYLAVQLYTSHQLPSESTFRNAIWQQLQAMYGELGVSRIGFWLTSYHPKEKRAIIRCQHNQVRPLRAALVSITEIASKPLTFHVTGISGTIRKAVTYLPGLDAKTIIRPRKHR